MRGSWRPNRTATYWPSLLSLSVFLSRSTGLLNWGPGFLYHILSPTRLIPKLSIAGCWLSQPHLVSNGSGLQTNWLPVFIELYNSSTPTQYLPITGHRNMHFRCLWNGMFDRHRAEITVMQFTGHSLPVHQFVTVTWDFIPVPYCQPSSHTPMEYALLLSLEWHVWPGRRSIYYILVQDRFCTFTQMALETSKR